MAGTDLINLQLVQDAYDLLLNNGVADDSITPNVDNGLRSDAMKTIAFFGKLKWTIEPSGIPTTGQITLNNDFDTATEINVFKTDDRGNDVSEALALISNGSVLFIGDYEGNYGIWDVTAVVDNTTYYTYTVTANASNPSYTPQGLEGIMTFYGGAGASAITDTNGIGNWVMANASGTIPGANGTFNFDNATVTSATLIRITDLDNDTADKGSLLGVIPEFSLVYLQDKNNRKNYVLISVGTITDNGSYFTYNILAISVFGTVSVGQEFQLIPVYTGNIMNSDNTLLSNHTQNLNSNLLRFENGFFNLNNGLTFSVSSGVVTYNDTNVSSVEEALGNTSTALVVDLSKGNFFSATANNNFTITFSNAPSADMHGHIRITQDATGSRVMSAGANVYAPGGVMPTLTTGIGLASDIVEFKYINAINKMYITAVYQDFQ